MSKKIMSRKVRNSYIVGFIVSVVLIMLFAYVIIHNANLPYYHPDKDEDISVFIFFLIAAFISSIISVIFIYADYTMTDEEKQKSDESVRKMLEEKQEPKSGIYIDNISYVGGHDSISTETIQSNGILSIKGDLLIYYSNYKKLFSIPISKIKSVTYDKSENITLTRIATLGLGALVFKKKTYYLLIEYIAKNELVNSLVFSPKIKDDRFLNELNVARNKYAYITKGNDLNEKIESKSTVEKLSLLKDLLSKDLISDEEYQKKKDEILNKL